MLGKTTQELRDRAQVCVIHLMKLRPLMICRHLVIVNELKSGCCSVVSDFCEGRTASTYYECMMIVVWAVTWVAVLCGNSQAYSKAVTGGPIYLFKLLPKESTADVRECAHMEEEEDIDSCIKIDINFGVMKQSEEIIMAEDGFVFKRKAYDENESGKSQSFSYEGDDFSFAVLTYTSASGYPDLNGRIHYTKDGASYMIDNCGENCHVLIKLGKVLMDIKEEMEPPLAPGARALSIEELDPVVSRNVDENDMLKGAHTNLFRLVMPLLWDDETQRPQLQYLSMCTTHLSLKTKCQILKVTLGT